MRRLLRIDFSLFLQNQLRTVTRLHYKHICSMISHVLIENIIKIPYRIVDHERSHSGYQLYHHIFIEIIWTRVFMLTRIIYIKFPISETEISSLTESRAQCD